MWQISPSRLVILILTIDLMACSSEPEYRMARETLSDINDLPAPLEATPPPAVPQNAMNDLLPSLSLNALSEPRFDVIAQGNEARSFFMGLVKGTGINMVIHPDVSGKITLDLKDVTLEETLLAVRDNFGYEYIRTDYGYRILAKTLQNKVFRVNYLNVTRTGRSGMSVSSGHITNKNTSDDDNASTTSSTAKASEIETQASTDFWLNLKSSVQLIIGNEKDRRVIVDPQAGLIVVRAFPEELASVEDFLTKAELSLQKQVVIEAKILEVSLSDSYQAGIRWDTFNLGPGGTFAASGKEIAGQLTATDLKNEDGLAGIFSLNFNFTDFNGVIQLLETQGDVQVLSSPRISTVNNQKAVIKVGTDEFFVTEVSTNTTSTTTTTTSTPELTLTPFFSGIALDVTPQIGENDDVILHVHPSVTEVVERNKLIEISGSSFDLPLAFSSIRETDSIIKAKNGQVVVIGGLLQNKKSELEASVPWLSKIPILGFLFKQKQKTVTKSELVILLQPKVIDPNEWSEEVYRVKQTFPAWKQEGANHE